MTLMLNTQALRYIILHTKITAVKNKVALSYHKVRGVHFLGVIFALTIVTSAIDSNYIRFPLSLAYHLFTFLSSKLKWNPKSKFLYYD